MYNVCDLIRCFKNVSVVHSKKEPGLENDDDGDEKER